MLTFFANFPILLLTKPKDKTFILKPLFFCSSAKILLAKLRLFLAIL